MNSLEFYLMFFMLAPLTTVFGSLHDISFSLCWMSKNDALERQNGKIRLNGTSLTSLRKLGKFTSLIVDPGVENKLTLRYGNTTGTWTLTIAPSKRFNKIQGLPIPQRDPTNSTKVFLDMLSPTEVFACENNTVFFYQDEDFFLATGHTVRLPLHLESRSSSMMVLSWTETAAGGSNTVTLYRKDPDIFTGIGVDSTTNNEYDFTSLESCKLYVLCVEIAGTHTFTCLPAITDPDIPKDFDVATWNSSSISLIWDYPDNLRLSGFFLTIFYLNGTDHVTEEVCLWLVDDTLEFTLSDLQPCARVRFGLQTVCQSGMHSRYSNMVTNDGNSVHSRIQTLRQTTLGADNYTLEWEVSQTSLISKFRVYHEEVLQGTTLQTNYSVEGLAPCQRYVTKVEALCGEDVVMSTKIIRTHTVPRGVSDLAYRSNNSTAVWKPSTTPQSALAFLYELSLKNGTPIESSRLTDTELRLPGLDEGKTYVLDVWEECDGEWESEHSQLCFEGANSTFGFLLRSGGPAQGLEMDLEFCRMNLTVVVPWSLPKDLKDDESDSRHQMKKMYKNKMQELLKDFHQPTRIEVVSIEPAQEPDKTEIVFLAFNALETEEDLQLPVEEQLDYIQYLNETNISVKEGVIYWDDVDLCESVKPKCPPNSLCINTLGSFTCVCQQGFYDVSSVIEAQVTSQPICNEKGLFSHCLEKLMTGGIAKPYLTAYIGGKVDVVLNDGRCPVEENTMLYYFRTSRKSSECGTERRVNATHFEYQNTLRVTLNKKEKITRRDLKVVWKCIYPQHYVRKAQVSMDVEWITSLAFIQYNASLQFALSMTLYKDDHYNSSYNDVISLESDDILFLQVALQTNNSFASGVLLQVDSCWATESTDPDDPVQGVFLQDGCSVDDTFYWLSVNGMGPKSRFSLQMFKLPEGLPLYIHCLANICGRDKDCTKNCTSPHRTKRSVSQSNRKQERAAVVSAGPLLVSPRTRTSHGMENTTMILIVAGLIGFLSVTVLSVSATKAIMTYYERLQQQ